MYVGFFCHLFLTDCVGTERGDTSFTGCGRDVFGDALHTDAVAWCCGVAAHCVTPRVCKKGYKGGSSIVLQQVPHSLCLRSTLLLHVYCCAEVLHFAKVTFKLNMMGTPSLLYL